jgi:hypothetical protein
VHSGGGVDEEIRALFVALVLHARLFGDGASESSEETETELSSSSDTVIVSNSSLLSPPPSPLGGPGMVMTTSASGSFGASKNKDCEEGQDDAGVEEGFGMSGV